MNRLIYCIVLYLIFGSSASAAEFKQINLDVLGKRLSDTLQLFSPLSKDGVAPTKVSLITCPERICAVELIYPSNITFQKLRSTIDEIYGKFKRPDQGPPTNPLAIWHIPKGKFTVEIQMQRNKDDFIEVIYLTTESFQWQKK